MLTSSKQIWQNFLHLIFPHNCQHCGTDVLPNNHLLCANCLVKLPYTGFESIPDNVVEKTFIGRLPVHFAMATFYFTQQSVLQQLIHSLKYKNNAAIGVYLGELTGYTLQHIAALQDADYLVPMPISAKRAFKRGYNQAEKIADGMATILHKPVNTKLIKRNVFTQTQTKNNRIDRWENMQQVFEVVDKTALQGKHIVLVDDIITTGATIEACGKLLIEAGVAKLSIVCVAYTS